MDKLKSLFAIMIIALLFVSLTSCGDDNDDEPGNNAAVVGTWVGNDYDTFYSNVYIRFNADGTGEAGIDHRGAYSSSYRAYFTYKVKGSKVTTTGEMASANSDGETSTQSFNNTYTVSGNRLTVESGSNWYKNAVSTYRKQ